MIGWHPLLSRILPSLYSGKTSNLNASVANLCFGGAKRNRLFMADTTSLYSLYTDAQGATLG